MEIASGLTYSEPRSRAFIDIGHNGHRDAYVFALVNYNGHQNILRESRQEIVSALEESGDPVRLLVLKPLLYDPDSVSALICPDYYTKYVIRAALKAGDVAKAKALAETLSHPHDLLETNIQIARAGDKEAFLKALYIASESFEGRLSADFAQELGYAALRIYEQGLPLRSSS